MTNNNCEYCQKNSWNRKNVVDEEGQVVEVEYVKGEAFLDVEISVAQAAPADFEWEFTRIPIDYCPKCGKKLI